MSFSIAVLASGSGGNSTWLGGPGFSILLDAGVRCGTAALGCECV